MDVNHEPYDRGEPLGSAHCQPLSLAACKAKAIRRVASSHWDEVLAEMESMGWLYQEETSMGLEPISGRPKQWIRKGNR